MSQTSTIVLFRDAPLATICVAYDPIWPNMTKMAILLKLLLVLKLLSYLLATSVKREVEFGHFGAKGNSLISYFLLFHVCFRIRLLTPFHLDT